MDREGDIAARFAEYHANSGVELLARAKHDRVFPDGQTLFARLQSVPSKVEHAIRVDRASSRRATRAQKAFAERDARLAETKVRWQELSLSMPKHERKRRGKAPFTLTAAHVIEPCPPAGVKPLEWLLLTTLSVTQRSEATKILDFYALRWRIEDWHRISKSGGDVEKIAYSTTARINRAVTINAIIARRHSMLTLLGRATPEIRASQLFDDAEIAVLLDFDGDMGLELPRQKTPIKPLKSTRFRSAWRSHLSPD